MLLLLLAGYSKENVLVVGEIADSRGCCQQPLGRPPLFKMLFNGVSGLNP